MNPPVPVPAFTRSGLAEYHRWLGIDEAWRDRLLAAYPTIEAANKVFKYHDYETKRDAIRVLGALGDLDAVLRHACNERQSSWIPTLACDILVQPPLKVFVAWLTRMKPSGDGSRLAGVVAGVLPRHNCSHIGDALVDFIATQKQALKTLSPSDLQSLGWSALPQAAKLLKPHVGLDTLRTYAQALEAGVARKACRPSWIEYMLGEEDRALDRACTAAIASAVALRRLGHPIDTRRVADWLQQLERLFTPDQLQRQPGAGYVTSLRWVLFDAGDDRWFDAMMFENASAIRHDVATTLLLRGDMDGFERWRQSIPEGHANLVHPTREVHYWPLIDHLQAIGMGMGSVGRSGDNYLFARACGVAAPHGWAWRCVPADD